MMKSTFRWTLKSTVAWTNVKLIILGNDEWWREDPKSPIGAHLFCIGHRDFGASACKWRLLPSNNSEHSTERKYICNLEGCAWQKHWLNGAWNDLLRTPEHEETDAGWREPAQGPCRTLPVALAQFPDGYRTTSNCPQLEQPFEV